MTPDQVQPRMVVWARFNSTKIRPWAVLWVDNEEGTACVVALTSQKNWVGAVSIGCGGPYGYAASWMSIQPLHNFQSANPTGYVFPSAVMRKIEAQLARNFDLREE